MSTLSLVIRAAKYICVELACCHCVQLHLYTSKQGCQVEYYVSCFDVSTCPNPSLNKLSKLPNLIYYWKEELNSTFTTTKEACRNNQSGMSSLKLNIMLFFFFLTIFSLSVLLYSSKWSIIRVPNQKQKIQGCQIRLIKEYHGYHDSFSIIHHSKCCSLDRSLNIWYIT